MEELRFVAIHLPVKTGRFLATGQIKKELERRINEGDKLGEVLEDVPTLKAYLLGGVSKEGEYKENPLAKLFRKSLGVYVKPKQWVSFQKNKDIDSGVYVCA